jgi:hypothetical protein
MSRINRLEATDTQSIRKWFAETVAAIGGEGWHADDSPSTIVKLSTGERLFSEEEAAIVRQAMKDVFKAARSWPEPDMVYDLAMCGSIPVEALYPGIIIDAFTSAGRLGYVSIPGREFPNLLVENGGQYAILEFPQGTGPISEHENFVLKAVLNLPADYSENPTSIPVDEENPVRFSDLFEVEDLVFDMAKSRGFRA